MRPGAGQIAELIRDAGGEIVGRTRLQKVAYLLELAGLGVGFDFDYHHYGPYSEELADAVRVAKAFELISEEERQTTWGGWFSIFKLNSDIGHADTKRAVFARTAAGIDAVELELAATAAYLASVDESKDPWGETAELKPEKASNGRLDRAKIAYRGLREIKTPKVLPPIA